MNSFDNYVGQVFDNRYKITKILGIGGMAVVFEAFDTKLNRIVALKMLKTEISNDSQSVKRFINESKAVSMLAHPNIVSVYDVSVKDNLKYIVMERVDGITLKSYISQKGALTSREALSYVEQILRALEHAHSKGIIHRDIKPQNIMLLKNGKIKVTDFGIAKLPNAETVTMTDKAIGTVYYISPEQASGRAIDQRSDLYSLGVMMYEMLTGKLPFDADSPVSVALMQVNTKPKPPHEIKSDIERGLEQIILLAMEKNPDRRFQNASQMLRHILQIKNSPNYVFKTKRTEEENRDTDAAPPSKEEGGNNADSIPKSVKTTQKVKKSKKTSKGGHSMFPVILAVTAAFLIVLAFCGIKVLNYFFDSEEINKAKPKEITVPNLVNQKLTKEYEAELNKKGYNIKYTYSNEDSDKEAKTILSQEPKAGTKIKAGYTDVKLVLSRGNEKPITLDDYTSKSYEELEEFLNAEGIKYTKKYEYDTAVDMDCIIRTDPMPGSKIYKSEEDPVIIYISKGKELSYVEVPNFIDLTKEQAIDLAAEKGITLGEFDEQTSSTEAGIVIMQDIAADTTITNDTKVYLTLSSGS
ncbi:MAG: Stk1 family PASTA domain-containing Ser/Thr kinase [Ruminococcaceae bacterium]|nr:Stk1 family PASTA domain-containing Ser/Thr kinase [Oscillospiraceae bacterium]